LLCAQEIINASKAISTPIITAKLVNDSSKVSARIVKAKVEKTTLGEVSCRERWSRAYCNGIIDQFRWRPYASYPLLMWWCHVWWLAQVAEYIKEVYANDRCYIAIKLDLGAIRKLHLEIDSTT
jgi:DNA-directed RNA polymerase III subunit RPC1